MSLFLAHLSDPHIGPLPRPRARDLMGKRLTGYINWRRRGGLHDMDVLARVVDDIRARRPDHVMMTGDVLNIGLPAEFPPAAAWLRTLGSPDGVSFTPGNHDAYVRGAMPYLATTFAPWTRDDGGGEAVYPYMRIRGDVALIGLSSGVPTAPFLASGRLGRDQLSKLAAMLDDARRRGLARVVMIHHPPWRGGARFGRGLDDAPTFEAVIAAHGAELIVHGHNHRLTTTRLPAPGGDVPVVGVASASAVPGSPGHRAAWHLFEISRSGSGWRVEGRARGLPPGGGDIVDLGPLTL